MSISIPENIPVSPSGDKLTSPLLPTPVFPNPNTPSLLSLLPTLPL